MSDDDDVVTDRKSEALACWEMDPEEMVARTRGGGLSKLVGVSGVAVRDVWGDTERIRLIGMVGPR